MRQPLTLHNNGAFAHSFREAGRSGSIAMHGANTAIGLVRETLNPICTPLLYTSFAPLLYTPFVRPFYTPLKNAFKHRIRYVPYPFPVNSRLVGQ